MYLQQNQRYQQQQPQNPINIDLDEKELWSKFYGLTNEMILTKAGRRTFPLIKISMNGLEENSLYTIQIEFRLSDNFKYRFVNGEWRTSPRTEKQPPNAILYEHSDSPNFGHHWSKDSIAFSKLKLTNNENSKSADAVYLRSLNKYDPVIHVFRHDKKNVDDKMLVFSHFFKETQFIAVTAYQNEQITSLKIKFNPFAKAFLNNNKPIITIENNAVVTSTQPKKEPIKTQPAKAQYSVSSITKQEVDSSYQQQAAIEHSSYFNHHQHQANFFKPTQSAYTQPEFIQNWYSSRSKDTTSHMYPVTNQFSTPSYMPYSSHTESSTTPYNNAYGFDYATSQHHLNNQYLQYQQRFYPTPYYTNQQQQQQTVQHQQQDLNQVQPYNYQSAEPQLNNSQFDSTYSPTNDYYNKTNNTSSAKRTALKENRHAPYITGNRQTRRASNNSSNNTSLTDNLRIPISPVYNTSCTTNYDANLNSKLEFNENNSDDSINSTEIFLTQLNNRNGHQNVQSSVSSVSSSYSNKTTNESGYYTHSPTGISHLLDSGSNTNSNNNNNQQQHQQESSE